MKTLLIAAALPMFASALCAQDNKHAAPPAGESSRFAPAAWLGIAMVEDSGHVSVGKTVDGSPAAKAGLQEGDVLLDLDGKVLEGMKNLAELIKSKAPGDTVGLRFRRGEKEETVKIKLEERPDLPNDPHAEFQGTVDRAKLLEQMQKAADNAQKEAAKAQEKLAKKLKEKALKAAKDDEDEDDGDDGDEAPKAKHHGKPDAAENNAPGGWRTLPGPGGKAPLLRWFAGPETPEFHFRSEDGPNRMEWTPRAGFRGPNPARKANEEHIWKQVERSISEAMKESGAAPEVTEKVMQAVKEAREKSAHRHDERSRLEGEAAKVEKELQALKARQEKLREQLKATE